ncbi:iron complex transport system substrate-binding protein [Caldalkalibacillus uzonensis]|uniref:Iron complex transport system substrate-binding protein n=1 Tax=Caldalkalibacillus uzonensis TaxID=353224 RepID=A0ABU0CQT8_9BACI|nr:iron-hydroxamate ABC transporter substrate-binding protein [Caldalkalibacillus uzonensis]MDQ0338784.1 iron complex transport system substrate-binding protein [Caldalkalibacillus uzonensis]
MWLNRDAKSLIIICAILLLGTLLTACGQTIDSTASEAEQAQADTTESETIRFMAANGEIELPQQPERIVVIADSYVGYFMALGITPVGISENALKNPYFEGKVDGIESIGDSANPSLEKILELKPDLIVTFSGTENIDQLEKIAPTAAIEYGQKDLREQLRDFGNLTGREEEAEAWIAGWEEKIAEYKPQVQEAVGDQTVSILQPYAKGIYAFGHNYARGGEIIYGEFELKAPEMVQKEAIDSGQGWADLSLEMLPDYAGDYIFTSAWAGDDADPDVVYNSTIWKSLPAVKNNRVFKIDPVGSFYNDPVSLEEQLDFIVQSLTQ